MTRILIADDHPIMRYGLAQLIDAQSDLETCCEVGTAAAALSAVPANSPDLIVADISLPDRNGLELIKDLRALYPDLRILVVSMHDESLYAERALRAGARGYIMKEEAAEKLIEAIRTVLAGRIYVSDAMTSRLMEVFSSQSQAAKSPLERLSDRELEVFQLIGDGKATKEIASQLNISVRTVDAHRAHIKEKLGIPDGSELVRHAVRWRETGQVGS